MAPQTRKSLAVTRSFGRPVLTWPEMQQAIASYATRAAEKLRRHGLVAKAMQVLGRTNEFNKDPKYANQATFEIESSADTMSLIGDAVRAGQRQAGRSPSRNPGRHAIAVDDVHVGTAGRHPSRNRWPKCSGIRILTVRNDGSGATAPLEVCASTNAPPKTACSG